jgi:hypothetical protein
VHTEDVVSAEEPARLESAPAGICTSRHPLLEDLQCQRLKGHPGRHGAAAESSSTELTMEWTGDGSPVDPDQS